MFESILDSSSTLSMTSVLLCSGCAIVLGLIISLVHMASGKYSKNFAITLAILPFLVSTVIIMVNGNLGTSVAVLGAFSLVRFRSIPGNSREIASVFLAMAIGLAIGMGQLIFASFLTIFASLVTIILSKTSFGTKKNEERKLKIVIPEDLDFTGIFDDIFTKYMKKQKLEKVKTTNLGSLYELTYRIELKENINEKELIDELRCRNGNLNIILGLFDENTNDL